MNIQDKIETLSNYQSLGELTNLLNQARTDVTFWGTRTVQVDGFEGSITLKQLSLNVLRLGISTTQADAATADQRRQSGPLLNKIRDLHMQTDQKLKTASYFYFARFSNWFSESLFPYSARWHLENCRTLFHSYNGAFRALTQAQKNDAASFLSRDYVVIDLGLKMKEFASYVHHLV